MSKSATQGGTIEMFANKVIAFLVKGLGTGLIPRMPGTWGSLLGLGFVYYLGTTLPAAHYMGIITFVVCILSWLLIALYENSSHKHDDQQVVIDEVAGIFVCFLGVSITMPNLCFGFVLFRILDIFKPFPISWVDQKIPGAIGTLLDDLLAGLGACALLHLANFGGWI